MSLAERIASDSKEALKSGNSERLGVLRLLLSELHNKGKEKFAKEGTAILTDDEVITVLQKESKKRRDAIDLFRRGERKDLVEKEDAELAVIGKYLPELLSSVEIKKILERLFANGFKDFNSLMKEAMKEIRGMADGRTVAESIKEMLK